MNEGEDRLAEGAEGTTWVGHTSPSSNPPSFRNPPRPLRSFHALVSLSFLSRQLTLQAAIQEKETMTDPL